MSDEPNKKGGLAALGAGIALLIGKGGMAIGHALSHASVVKPAIIAEEAAHGLSAVSHSAPAIEDAAKGIASGAAHLGAGEKLAEDGARGLVKTAGPSRVSTQLEQDMDRIARSGSAYARRELRNQNRDRREEEEKRK